MKLIKQSHKIWGRCPSDVQGALKWIERAGRVRYASAYKITEDSALPFIQNLIESGDLGVLEHSEISIRISWASRYITNWDYSYDTANWDYSYEGMLMSSTGNLRTAMEQSPTINGKNTFFQEWLEGKFNDIAVQPPKEWERYTVEFTTNRAMIHALVRHRPCSFSQQYIHYSNKNPMQFIEPVGFQDWTERAKDIFASTCVDAVENYHQLIFNQGVKPQQARNILPHACVTKIVVTADRAEWELIFKLRCGDGADPQMVDLMTPVREEMYLLWDSQL